VLFFVIISSDIYAPSSPILAKNGIQTDNKIRGGGGVVSPTRSTPYRLPRLKNFQQMRNWANQLEIFSLQPLVGGERYGCRGLSQGSRCCDRRLAGRRDCRL
jgi:hypothetical protein